MVIIKIAVCVLAWLFAGFLISIFNWYAVGPYTNEVEARKLRAWAASLTVVLGMFIFIVASNWIFYLIALLAGAASGRRLVWNHFLSECLVPVED